TENEIKIVIKYFLKFALLLFGWIDDFNKMISRYIIGFRLLKILIYHDDIVNSVMLSGDGKKIVSSSNDNTVRIWDISLGKEIMIFRGHNNNVFIAKFSPDGNNVVSCSIDGMIQLWDISTGINVMNTKINLGKIYDLKFSPDGKYIMSYLENDAILLFDISSEAETKKTLGHSRRVLSAQFSPDSKLIVSSSSDKSINLWSVESGKILKQFKFYVCATHVIFSPDGQYIAYSSMDLKILTKSITGKRSKILKGSQYHVNALKYFPDGLTLISCSNDNAIRFYDIKLGKEIKKLEGHYNSTLCVDISKNGDRIISGSADRAIRIWGL
ncbi:WD-40 repeat protein, partial [Reticulomyxa filosa]